MAGATKVVLWIGEGRSRTHDPMCAWALAREAASGLRYPHVPVPDVPRTAPRCSFCGGGR